MLRILFVIGFYACIFLPYDTQAQSWSELGTGANSLNANSGGIYALNATVQGNVYAAGKFTDNNGYRYIADWNGTSWNELGTGANALNANSNIWWVPTDTCGNLYTIGAFANSDHYTYVAKWNGTSWSQVGTGANELKASAEIFSIAFNGSCGAPDIYVAGWFTNPSGYEYVARWDGSNWSELGSGANALDANSDIASVITDAAGNVYAAGNFTDASGKWYVAKWDGTSWSELGTGANALNANNSIASLAQDAAGNIYAAGVFTDASGKCYVAKWDGSSWSEVGTGTNGLNANNFIYTILFDGAGNLYAAGGFTNTNGHSYVAKWDGSNWAEVGAGSGALNANNIIRAISVDAGGNVYAAGNFKNGSGYYYVAKYSVNTAVKNVSNENSIHVYPNPAVDKISFYSGKPDATCIATISDLAGRQIYSSQFTGICQSADVSQWCNGMYICTMTCNGVKTSQKFVVSH